VRPSISNVAAPHRLEGSLVTDSEPTAQSRLRRVVVLRRFTVIALVVSALTTVFGIANEDLRGGSSALIYYFAVALFTVPSVWLLLAADRMQIRTPDHHGHAVSSALVAGFCLYIGCFISLPLTAITISEQVDVANARMQPLTAAETAYTPDELRSKAEAIAIESLAALMTTPPAADDIGMHARSCELSNQSTGTSYFGSLDVDLDVSQEEFLNTVTTTWKDMGLRIDASFAADGRLRASGGVVENLNFSDMGPWVRLELGTVCTKGSAPE
jgi:hypothetical protein